MGISGKIGKDEGIGGWTEFEHQTSQLAEKGLKDRGPIEINLRLKQMVMIPFEHTFLRNSTISLC
jgi:hypothetical protein